MSGSTSHGLRSRYWSNYRPNYRPDYRPNYQWYGAGIAALAAVGTLLGVFAVTTLPAQAQRTAAFDLDRAICSNDWNGAISIVGGLVAQAETTSVQRDSLLALRRQLERYRSKNAVVTAAQACDRTDPYFLEDFLEATLVPADQASQPLGWEGAVAEAANNQYSTEIITESVALRLPVSASDSAGLTPAEPVDLSTGLNVVSGQVGSGHEVYGFVAGRGDRLAANLEVTRVMTGSLYTSDDSQLFIFDRHGNLIASADDTSGTQLSRISGVTMPKTDLYFAVVTSYNNDPIVNPEGQLTGWQDNGGGRFDYTLTLSGVTPTSVLMR